ncbi:agmatine deiminase family protein [Companilactobacillus nuruki]|uniref:Peptidyl-arginine deiminase n=1 Tax=Companilactobacillus nuruki TaxID=1993540 RepID=A0A2N7ARR4_9LACO|nr:agmatine deiminase family protein [Companilactobacillus nuruki]PMD68037.1 hypothetical protein CBP76_10530 [Companilactobacillus nuruki]
MKKIIIATLMSLLSIVETSNINVYAETIYTSMPTKDDNYYRSYRDDLEKFNLDLQTFSTRKNRFITLDTENEKFQTEGFNYPDIWIRDVAPVITTKMVKFRYSPNYLKKSDSNYLNARFNKFLKEKYKYRKSELILDGGNLQWNGAKTVVLTDQVYNDNRNWSKQEIISELKYRLKIDKVIIISKEPGDVLGHSDGMIKFIERNKMFINDFSYEPGFLKKIENQILRQDPHMKFIVLPSSYTSSGQYDSKIASAKGLYINMLETEDAVYFPMYGLKKDHQVLNLVKKEYDKKVIPISVGRLSTLGGSIHCLTWDVPDRFRK